MLTIEELIRRGNNTMLPEAREILFELAESRTRLESLRSSRDEWKADAEKLATLVQEQLNAYDMMGLDGVTSITDEGYLKLERALLEHNSLAEKDRETKWRESTKRVLEENRGAWEELG